MLKTAVVITFLLVKTADCFVEVTQLKHNELYLHYNLLRKCFLDIHFMTNFKKFSFEV